jgi:CHAD domain-containing protein
MTMPTSSLQAADGGPLPVEAVSDALSAEFGVSAGPRAVVRRTRLDTFDHRLRSAGLTLDHVTSALAEQLVLSRSDGTATSVVPVSGLQWPARADALPDGPLRDVVAAASDIRALMVAADEKRRVRRLELRNADQKTVVRVELDEPAARGAATPPTVTVRAMRGYEDQARRAARLLADHGLRSAPLGPDGNDEGDPADGSGPSAAPIDPAAPAQQLLALQLGRFLAAMRVNVPGLLDDIDTEFLHDFRVAVRRTRSTLKLGRDALPEVMRSRWEPDFKWLGDLTTPVRDLDVYELDLPMMAGWLVAADAADLDPFAAHLRRRRTAERRSLVRGLRSARFQRLVADWEQTLAELTGAELTGAPVGDGDVLSAEELAHRSIRRAHRRVVRIGEAISADSPGDDLHTLRKRCKELRYALEVFAPVVDKDARKKAVSDLKGLQDVLGRFQDAEVQRAALRLFADEMMAAGTVPGALLAMGELVGHLDADQDRAREDFDGAFARFTRPASERRMKALGGRS